MSNVIEFPTAEVREWAVVSNAVRELLEMAGVEPDGIEWIVADFKPRFEESRKKYEFNIAADARCIEALNALNEHCATVIRDLEWTWIAKLLAVEVELYRALHH